VLREIAQKSFRKGFSCKPTGKWASITDDTHKSSFSVIDFLFWDKLLVFPSVAS